MLTKYTNPIYNTLICFCTDWMAEGTEEENKTTHTLANYARKSSVEEYVIHLAPHVWTLQLLLQDQQRHYC